MGKWQRGEVGRWEIRKTLGFGNPTQIACEIPDDFAPSVDTTPEGEGKSKYTVYDVTLAGLIDAGFCSLVKN